MQLHNTLCPPFSKYYCRDISGEGTSAELMQCVRSIVTQSLLQDSTRGILRTSSLLLLLLPQTPLTKYCLSITCCSTVYDAHIDS